MAKSTRAGLGAVLVVEFFGLAELAVVFADFRQFRSCGLGEKTHKKNVL